MSTSLDDLTRDLVVFRDARDWRQFHGLKNLMVSVGLEAAELLELTQWKDDGSVEDEALRAPFRDRVGEECADVFIYLLLICERLGLDLEEVTRRKIERNGEKYPVEKARGSARKYTEL